MKVCAHCNRFVLGFGEAHGFSDLQRKAANAPGVAFASGVAKIDRRAKRFEGVWCCAFGLER